MDTDEAHLQRAFLLYQHGHYSRAVEELRPYLLRESEDAIGYALLALCLNEIEDPTPAQDAAAGDLSEALQAAITGVRLGPDQGFTHYAHAVVLESRGQGEGSEIAIREAIRLVPEDVVYTGFLACQYGDAERWDEALETAERGLAIDPEDTQCVNIRSVALLRLNRSDEALTAAQEALALNPENAVSHAILGIYALQSEQTRLASSHFRTALRLDPNLHWAAEGYVLALKGNTLYYRFVVSKITWIKCLFILPDWAFGTLLIGFWFGAHAVPRIAKAYPAWTPAVVIALTLYFLLNLFICISEPLLNRLVSAAQIVPPEAKASNGHPFLLIEITYLFSLACLPLSIAWFPGLLISLFADLLVLLAFIREFAKESGRLSYVNIVLTYGALILMCTMMVFLTWLRGY